MENPGSEPLPFGLGTHPYFRLPLGARGTAEDCRISLPVSSQWELVQMNATGQRTPRADAAQLQQAVRFGDLQLDCVFSGLLSRDDRCVAQDRRPEQRVLGSSGL